MCRQERDPYAQLKKNTVKAYGQLKDDDLVRFENATGTGIRVMFVGNSTTRHGVNEDIGWPNDWGMAASTKDKDYVHCLIADITKKHADAAFCICQVANWEWRYGIGSQTHHLFQAARDFEADIIITRFCVNCPRDNFDAQAFKREYMKLLEFLNSTGNAKFVLTTGFWHHPGNQPIAELAKEHDFPLVMLEDLCDDDAMKAIGLFAHPGVAEHPGDLGMRTIADRVYEKLQPLL